VLDAVHYWRPHLIEAVIPIRDSDLASYSFVENVDVVAGLDSRPDLTKMSPTEFEHFVRQLFEASGLEGWITQRSGDDGVDTVVINRDPLVGPRVSQCGHFHGCLWETPARRPRSALAAARCARPEMACFGPHPAISQSCMRYSRLARHERRSTTPVPPIWKQGLSIRARPNRTVTCRVPNSCPIGRATAVTHG
jgi:hypothetical protein